MAITTVPVFLQVTYFSPYYMLLVLYAIERCTWLLSLPEQNKITAINFDRDSQRAK